MNDETEELETLVTQSVDGVAVFDIPKKYAREVFSRQYRLLIWIDTPERNEGEFSHRSEGSKLTCELTKNGEIEKVNTPVRLRLIRTNNSDKVVLKPSIDKPSILTTAYYAQVSPGWGVTFDFGSFPPNWSYDIVEDSSIEPHTRIHMNIDLAIQLQETLKGILAPYADGRGEHDS